MLDFRVLSLAIAILLLVPSAASAEAPAEPAPDTVVAPSFVPPRLLARVEPVYPEEARQQGLTATVLLQLVVDANGAVTHAEVVHGAGHGFDEAAVAALEKTRFAPATHGGVPLAVQVNYELKFALAAPATLRDTVTASSAPGPAYESTVVAERPFTAASATTVRDRDFLLRPRHTPEDILRVVPGLVLAQHQGGGKADQLFLRGFDADHGTDVAVSLDGIPINMVSHAHGQGYADLHFLIPEVIERLELSKGPYFADKGDFDTAGAVNLVTRDRFEKSEVSVSRGSFDTMRFLGVASPSSGQLHTFFAAEAYATQGPFVHGENLERFNLFAKATYDLSPTTRVSLLGTAYSSSWNGSGQLPARLVDAGFLDRFGAIDATEGGVTQRQQAILALTTRPDAQSQLSASLSVIRYGLALFNDFTFQLQDPAHGDEIEQDDDRTTLVANVRYDRTDRAPALPGSFTSTLGASSRNDVIAGSLWRVQERVRLPSCGAALDAPANPCVNTLDRQTNASVFVQEDWKAARWLRLVGGLRYDLFDFEVHSLVPGGGLEPAQPTPRSPMVQRSILSPKGSAVLSARDDVDVFLNFGLGFHSNDARSAVETAGQGVLARALGYEVGARARLLGERLDLAVALWRLDLSSELVWSGDAGGTEPSAASRRQGVDVEARWAILPWLRADLDVLLAQSRFKADAGNGGAVALAPPVIVSGGLTVRHPSGLGASLRVRHLGDRPGNAFAAADGVPACTPAMDASDPNLSCYLVAQGYTVVDLHLDYVTERWALSLLAENLTNTAFREAQFGNDSQVVAAPGGRTSSTGGVAWTPETHPVRDIHYTPGSPFGALVTASLFF